MPADLEQPEAEAGQGMTLRGRIQLLHIVAPVCLCSLQSAASEPGFSQLFMTIEYLQILTWPLGGSLDGFK